MPGKYIMHVESWETPPSMQGPPAKSYVPKKYQSALTSGFKLDITPDMPHVPRCKEIIGWLEKHSEVNRFAVIDDEDDGLDELPLFEPSARTGLTDEIVGGVRDYLNGITDRDMRCGRVARIFQNIWAMLRRHPG
jgi:hypothetical protein